MCVIFELAGFVSALVNNPLLFLDSDFALLFTVIVADYSLGRVIVTITDIVSSFRNAHRSLLAINEESFTSRSHAILDGFCVETSIVGLRIRPFLVLELKIVIEEVFSFNELSTVPLSNIFALIKMNREG